MESLSRCAIRFRCILDLHEEISRGRIQLRESRESTRYLTRAGESFNYYDDVNYHLREDFKLKKCSFILGKSVVVITSFVVYSY